MKDKRLLTLISSVWLILALVALPCMAACAKPEPVKKYKVIFSEVYAEDTPYGEVIKRIVENVDRETNGRIEWEIHYGGSLMDRPEAVEAVQNGTIQMTEVTPSNNLQPYESSWCMLDMPLLVRSKERMLSFWNSEAGKELQRKTAAKGITCMIPYGDWKASIFNTRHPIEKIEDFQGLKLRVPTSPVLVATIEALGGQAVSIPMSESPMAISTGMVDGFLYAMETDVMTVWDAGHTAPYWLSAVFFCPIGMVIVNTDWLNSLPADIKAGVIKGIEDARELHIELFDKDYEEALQAFRAAPGTVVTDWDENEMSKALELLEPIYTEYADKSDGWAILNTFLEMD